MTTRLKNLRLDRIDLVDKGSNQEAHVVLFKRDDPDEREIEWDEADFASSQAAEVDKAKLTGKQRGKLKAGQFAYVDENGKGHLPIHDAAHVRNALARFNQTSIPADKKAGAKKKILAAAKRLGVKASEAKKGAFVEFLKAVGSKLGLSEELIEAVEKDYGGDGGNENGGNGGQASTFGQELMDRRMDDLLGDLCDCIGALWDVLKSILCSDEPDKGGAIEQAVADFSTAINAAVSAWLTTASGGVAKAGKKISATRLAKLKQVLTIIQGVITEQEGAGDEPASKGDTMSKIALATLPEPVQAILKGFGITEPTKEQADHAATLVVAKKEEPKGEDVWKGVSPEIRKRVEDAERSAANSEKVAKAERDARLKSEYISKAAVFKGLPIKADDDWALFKAITENLEPAQAERVMALFRAGDAAIVKSFTEIGRGGEGAPTGSVLAEVEAKAAEFIQKDGKLTPEQARAKVWKTYPDLYTRYEQERLERGGR